jgi:tetratricopeptide (TPR) repeat protein
MAMDPTANWIPGRLLSEFRQASASNKSFANKALFMSISNLDIGADLTETLADTTFLTESLRAQLDLDEFLKKDQTLQLRYGSRFYANEVHTTVPLLTEYDALHFIFDFYDMNLKVTDFEDPSVDLMAKMKAHYQRVSEAFGYEVKPDEALVNSLGYQFLMMQQLDKAGGLFELNVSLYPESANVYDSLGDYYAASGAREKAIESYQKAQGIEYHDYTEQKLKQLQNE